jgi:hypothetical protein
MMDSIVKQLPQLTPLEKSFAVDDVEAQLKQMFIDLFNMHLAERAHDVNVLGMAHLGSLDLVRRIVSVDGLVFIPNNREEATTRRIYRAWKAGNAQGRGLHFLRAYLQLLFPNSWTIDQQMQAKAEPYPTALYPVQYTLNDADKYLTSRIKIWVSAQSTNAGSVSAIAKILKDIIPARLVPEINISETSSTTIRIGSFFTGFAFLHTSGTTK